MKLISACALPLVGALAACHPAYALYVTNDGNVHHDIPAADALRLSAEHDLDCETGNVRVRRIVSPSTRGAVDEIAEGCGRRVVLREECGPQRQILPASFPESESERDPEVDEERPYACRHVLLSRVEVEEPR